MDKIKNIRLEQGNIVNVEFGEKPVGYLGRIWSKIIRFFGGKEVLSKAEQYKEITGGTLIVKAGTYESTLTFTVDKIGAFLKCYHETERSQPSIEKELEAPQEELQSKVQQVNPKISTTKSVESVMAKSLLYAETTKCEPNAQLQQAQKEFAVDQNSTTMLPQPPEVPIRSPEGDSGEKVSQESLLCQDSHRSRKKNESGSDFGWNLEAAKDLESYLDNNTEDFKKYRDFLIKQLVRSPLKGRPFFIKKRDKDKVLSQYILKKSEGIDLNEFVRLQAIAGQSIDVNKFSTMDEKSKRAIYELAFDYQHPQKEELRPRISQDQLVEILKDNKRHLKLFFAYYREECLKAANVLIEELLAPRREEFSRGTFQSTLLYEVELAQCLVSLDQNLSSYQRICLQTIGQQDVKVSSIANLSELERKKVYELAYNYNNFYVYEPYDPPISGSTYSINTLWINKEVMSDQENLLSKEFESRVARWAELNPESKMNVWYDGKLSSRQAVENSKAAILKILDGKNCGVVEFLDIYTIDIVSEWEILFNSDVPVYLRVDLVKAVVSDYNMRKQNKEEFSVVTDLDVTPMPGSQIFDKKTVQLLEQDGIVLGGPPDGGFLGFENSFHILNRNCQGMVDSHRKILIDLSLENLESRIMKGISPKSFEEQMLYDQYERMFFYYQVQYKDFDCPDRYFEEDGSLKVQVFSPPDRNQHSAIDDKLSGLIMPKKPINAPKSHFGVALLHK